MLIVHQEHLDETALQKANSSLYCPLHRLTTDQPRHLQTAASPHYRIHPTFNLFLLKPYHTPVTSPYPSSSGPGVGEPALLLPLDDGPVYSTNKILGSQRCRGRLEYLVDWEGNRPRWLKCLHFCLTARWSWVRFPHGALLVLGHVLPRPSVLRCAISRAFLCGVCMFSLCSQGVSSTKNPNRKNMPKNRSLSCPSLTKT